MKPPFAPHMVDRKGVRAWLESTKTRGMALGLEHTKRALELLALPAPHHEVVHVAGSNGKGTTVASLCAALTEVGIPNLSFTSPHLVRIEERIRIDGRPVVPTTFDAALATVKAMSEQSGLSLTFFETTFLVAMVVASQSDVEVVVLETGLGGRLDATRVAHADVSVITSLSLEHSDVLGSTLSAIASEKVAIARPRAPLVVRRPPQKEVVEAIVAGADKAGNPLLGEDCAPAKLHWVDAEPAWTYHQEAMALARAAWPFIGACKAHAFPDLRGLKWPARMQRLHGKERADLLFILDGAHNPSGMIASCRELEVALADRDDWALLVGTSPQTHMRAMLAPLATLCEQQPPVEIVVSVPQGGRYPGVPGEELVHHLGEVGLKPTRVTVNPEEAVQWFEGHAKVNTVVSIGSLYMQGNVMEALGAVDDDALSIEAKQ